MILVDTTIWIDHLRATDALLVRLLEDDTVLMHPFVLGEIALGNLADRVETLTMLAECISAVTADEGEVAQLIEAERLFGIGIGYVDAHLLASTRLTADAMLWTRDRRLNSVAERLGIAARLTH